MQVLLTTFFQLAKFFTGETLCINGTKNIVVLAKLFALVFSKAFAAVYRTVFFGFKGNLSLFTAFCTDCSVHLSVLSDAVLSCNSAFFTTAGFVFKTLFSIKFLLARCEYKFSTTVFAYECLVFVHYKSLTLKK